LFKELLNADSLSLIVLDEFKLFYYRGLKEYKNQLGFLLDTFYSMQDEYVEIMRYFTVKI
jgi:hypothetical protein